MDVILFADNSAYQPNNQLSLPIRMAGPFRLATELRQNNITCQIIDFLWSFTPEEINNVCKKFITSKTKVVGFSATFWWPSVFDNESKQKKALDIIFDYVKIHAPTCKMVCGGAWSTYLSKFWSFDKIFSGYSDLDFLSYVSMVTGVKNLNTQFDFTKSFIRYIDNDLINYNDTVTIEISRGCIFKCKFCAYPLNGKQKFDYIKDMHVLRDELIENYQNYNITNYIFSDDTFNDSTYKLTLLHEMFQTLPFKIRFSCYLRLDLLNRYPEQIPLLYDMGLRAAFFGVESFNDLSAKIIGKGISGNKSKELITKLKTDYWKNEVLITVAFIIGLPHETIANIKDTMLWIKESPVDSVGVNPLGIIKNSKKMWLSEFELNYQKYGYTFESSSDNWNLNSGDITSLEIAKKYAKIIKHQSDICYKGTYTSNFAVFLLPNLLRYTNYTHSIDDLIKMSGQARYDLRNLMWKNNVGGLYLKDYKIKLNNL